MTTPHLVRNTSVEYLYRDNANWKEYKTIVLAGEITDEQIAAVLARDPFLPEQVGLDSLVGTLGDGSITEDDQPWHEMSEIKLTDAAPNDGYATASDWVARFAEVIWDEDAAEAAMGDL